MELSVDEVLYAPRTGEVLVHPDVGERRTASPDLQLDQGVPGIALPPLLLALVVTGFLGPGLTNLALAMTAVWWLEYAHVVRGLVLGVKERPYVESARSLARASPIRPSGRDA